MRQTAAAIEIGTSKVVCMIAEKGVYDGFNLLGISVNEYAGYNRSGWLEPRELKYTISSVLRGRKAGGTQTAPRACWRSG